MTIVTKYSNIRAMKKTAIIAAVLLVLLSGLSIGWQIGRDSCSRCERYLSMASTANTRYVITPQKLELGVTDWTVRENVVFGSDHFSDSHYVGSRGFEFRWEHTPEKPFDPAQEIHTTINLYDDALYTSKIARSGDPVELANGVIGFLSDPHDEANTWNMTFSIGRFYVQIKSKYVVDADAVDFLMRSADILIGELLVTCEAK